jgi:putative endonuclease
MDYYIYIIKNSFNHSYIGITNNLEKRILLHNSKKGAKATRKSNDWIYYRTYGKYSKEKALSLEWYCKHEQSKTGKWRRVKSDLEYKIKHIEEQIKKFN